MTKAIPDADPEDRFGVPVEALVVMLAADCYTSAIIVIMVRQLL
jgi:hypothetical protein